MNKYWIIWVFAAVLISCAGESSLNRVLDSAEEVLEENPDSSLRLLQSIDSTLVSSRKAKIRYYLIESRAKHKKYTLNDSDLYHLQQLIEFCKRGRFKEGLMKALYFTGYIHLSQSRFNEAIDYLSEAEPLAETLGNSFYAGLIYREKASAFTETFSPRESLIYIEKAVDAFSSGAHLMHHHYALLQLGIALNTNKRYHEADSVYQLARQIAEESADSLLLSQSIDCMANNYVSMGEYDKALSAYSYMIDSLRTGFSSRDYSYMGEAYAHKGKSDAAFLCFDYAETLAASAFDRYIVNLKRYEAAKLYDYKDVKLESVEKVITYVTSEDFEQVSHSAEVAQKLISEKQKQLAVLETRLTKQKMVTVVLGASIAILLLSLILIISIQISKARMLADEAEKAKLKNRIESLSAEYAETAHNVGKFSKLLLNTFVSQNWKSQSRVLDPRLQPVITALMSDEKVNDYLIQLLNATHNNLLIRVGDQVPNLKSEDILLYCYVVSGFNHNTICAIEEKASSALNAKVYRLRKKIVDSNAPDKEEFLSLMPMKVI